MTARAENEDLTKRSRRVSITLTKGQDYAIRDSFMFKLCGSRYSEWLRHAMMETITRDHHSGMERKIDETLRLLREKKQ